MKKLTVGIFALILGASAGIATAGHQSCSHGGAGTDIIGTSGNDTCDGTSSGENMFGRAGADTLLGHGGWDDIHGEDGQDYLNGSDGSDAVQGGLGGDRINGNSDDDNVLDTSSNNDHDHACDGPGFDTVRINDSDDLDTWFNYPDGQAEVEVSKDTNDTIKDNATNCPSPGEPH